LQPIGFSTKSVQPSIAPPGHLVTYTIGLTNGGTIDLTNVWITETLPVSLTYAPGSLVASAGSYGHSSGTITWTGIVSSQQVVIIEFRAAISPTLPRDTTLGNSVVISSSEEILTRTATVVIPPANIFLPICFRNYCPDFYDDFSDPASGWPVGEDEHVRSEYLAGEYRILTQPGSDLHLFRAPTCPRDRYTVEADARWFHLTGNSYGLLLGAQDDQEIYYLFDLNSQNQMFQLYRGDQDGWQESIVPPTYSSAINAGLIANHMRATLVDDEITLEVNDTVLGTWYVGPLASPSFVGLATSASPALLTNDVRFDNFRVSQLLDSGTQMPATVDSQTSRADCTHDACVEP
jgi:uncharacterized repeat protein (TIGR01451 family)